ncbi:MAG: acyl-CoA dehydrogenase family protein [Rubrivivax sp.]
MTLDFSDDELRFRDEVRQWVDEHLPPDIGHKVSNGLYLDKSDYQRWARILGARGWLAAAWPERFGGPGWTPIQRHLFAEACALAGAPPVLPFGPVMVAPVIMKYGSPEQQQRHLPGIRSGEVWWCQGYSEPGAGSDLASLKTRAVPDGDHYRVSGQKTWTTQAHHADWMFCLVRTATEGRPQEGISFLLIDMRSPGITVRPIITIDGEHHVNEVFLDDVRVPLANRVGEENRGWTYAKFLLGHERSNIADVNRAKRELRRLKRLAHDSGRGSDVRFMDQVALLEVDIVALELLSLRALAQAGSGLDMAALLKIRGSEIQQRYTELMMLAAGPRALPLADEYGLPYAAAYFGHRKTSIYGGANEVQRNIVAQQLLAA